MIGWFWAGTAAAAGGDDRWWASLPVADVVFEATAGGLPEQNLESLLRARDGEPLDPGDIRLDLATLFQVGEFAGVEARVEPFTVFDERGEAAPGVLLTYLLTPAPKVAKVKWMGGDPLPRLALSDALAVDVGQVFFPEVDGRAAEERLEGWLLRQGWIGSEVTLRTSEPEPGQLYVAVDVDPGRPNTLDALTFLGDLDGVVSRRALARWSARAGLRVGDPVTPESVSSAQDAIRERLGDVRGSLLRPARGWIGARVTPAVIRGAFEGPDGAARDGVRVTFSIEPGARLVLDVGGMGFNGRRKAEAALGIDHRLRVTRGWLDDAPGRLVEFLQDRGYHAATAVVEAPPSGDRVQRLTVRAERGGLHELGASPDLRYVDLDVAWGDGAAPEGREREADETALQAVFDQASPDVIRQDVYTERAMRTGAEAARQLLVDRGQLEARVEVLPPEVQPRRTLANLARGWLGAPLRSRITPRIRVSPGATTRLLDLEIAGAVPGDVDLSFVEAARAAAIGGPYSPQDLEALSRRILEAHRAVGYLEAASDVEATADGALGRRAVITVDPGPRVFLRSSLVRGAVRTRSPFLQAEIDAPLGAPVTTGTLETIRGNLYDLGVFRTVSTDLLGDDPARDLLVTVDEVAPWLLEGGAGLSTDQGVRLFGRATRSNLFGVAHRAELFGQLGLDYRSEDIRDWTPDILNPEWRAAVSYTAPRFPLRAQEVVADLVLRERIQERTWRMDRTGLGVALQTRLPSLRTELRVGARLENRQLNQVDTAALLEGEPWDLLLGDAPALPSPWRWQESLTALGVLDLRDDPIQPRTGALVSLNGEAAPGLPWPDQPLTRFLKGEARLSLFVPMGPLTLQVSGRGGHVRGLSDGLIPLEDRFRLGGTNSLRGFVRDGVGPQNNAPRVAVQWPDALGPVIDYALRDDPDRWTPTGGDSVAVATAELFVPLPALGMTGWEGYSTELFWDVGNVWLSDPDATATTDDRPALPAVRHGVGVGFQSATPIGPLALDLALNPQAAFASGLTRALLVGELEEPWWRAHLTLGATF